MNYSIPKKPREYFNIEEYRECGLQKPGGITIINGGRDIGKTTGTLLNDLQKTDGKNQLFFVRNTEKELKAYAKSFNANYGTQFWMSETTIYRVAKKEWIEKKTKEHKTTYAKTEIVGFCGALNGVDSWRSANFDNVKVVYVDEYNQIGNSLNAEKFLTLWTSILRTRQDVYTTIVGNRDDVAADLLIELGIEILVPDDFEGDWVVPLLPNDKDFADKAFFIDLDDSRFTNNAKPTIWKALGRKMEVMGKYYDRGYKSYDNADCKKLAPEVMEKISWKFAFHMEDVKLVFGEINGVWVAHWDKEKEIIVDKNYAPHLLTLRNKGLINITNNEDWPYAKLSQAMKNTQILYTSILAKEETILFVDDLAFALEKKDGFRL